MGAKREDWETTTLPTAREALHLDRVYMVSEFERIKAGAVPKEMEDKWFVFYEEPWLYLHRSWTGYCIYQVRFELTADGVRVIEVLSNRNPQQYSETDDSRDALWITCLLDGYAGRNTETIGEQYSRLLREGRLGLQR